jgi:hypothetical protein
MNTATRKGVDEEGRKPLSRAVEQMAGLNEAAEKISKFRTFAAHKNDSKAPQYEDFVLMGTYAPAHILGTSTVSDWPQPQPPLIVKAEYAPYARTKQVLREVAYYAMATIIVIGVLAFVGFVL